jgi:hypothetical protein
MSSNYINKRRVQFNKSNNDCLDVLSKIKPSAFAQLSDLIKKLKPSNKPKLLTQYKQLNENDIIEVHFEKVLNKNLFESKLIPTNNLYYWI